MQKKMRVALLIASTILMTTSCASVRLNGGTGESRFCKVYKEIITHPDDHIDTVRQAEAMNEIWDRECVGA